VPTFDPLRCKELITSLTVERASFALIKDKLGAEKWDKLIEEADPVPSFISCYKSHQVDVKSKFDRRFSSKPYYETYPPQRRQEEKLKYEKKLEEESERKNAACLKETIVWSSVHLAKDMLGVAITEMKADFGDINLSDENLLLLSSKIQECFKVEIESFNTISSVGDSIEPITNKCGMKLIKEDEDFKKLLLKPIMLATLTESGIEGDNKDKYADALINDLRKFIEEQKVHSLEQFKTKASEYKVRGTVMVIEMVINDKIDEQFSGMKPDELAAVKLELKPQIDKLINEGENSLKNKLILASQSEDPNASKKAMSKFTIDATRIVASRVLGFEKQKMVKDKILESSVDADQFEQYAKGRLNNCLNNIDVNQPELVEGKLTTCTQDLKKDSISWVVDKRISKELKEPLLKDLFTEAELKSLKGNILNSEFKRKVHAISRMEDSDQASIALNLLVSDLTADATKKIASSVLPKTLSQVMSIEPGTSPTKAYVIKQRRDQISASAIGTFSSCIDKAKQKNKKVIHGEEGIQLESGEAFDAKKAHNRCLNIFRLDSSKGVLKFQYEEGLNFVDLNSPKRTEIINGKLAELNICSNAIDLYSDSKSYSYKLEACLANNALGFVRKTIEHGRNMAGNLIRQNSNTMTSFNKCLGGMKANAIESMKKFDPNNAELVSLSQRSSGLTEEKFITESVILSSKLKESTGKPFPKVDVTWITSQVKHCVFDDLAGNVLNEFKEGLASNPRFGLNESDKENITLLVDGFTEILKMPGPSDGHVRITNNAARERRSSAQNNTTPPPGGAPDKSTIDVLKDLLPTIVDYIKLVGKYDSAKSRTNLKLLLARLKDKVRNNGGVMDMDEIIDITMKSELMDDIIRAVISKEVKVTAEKALRAFIPNRGQRDRVAKKLSSKAMINRIFSSTDPKARAILDSIKNDYIKKLIKGEIESSQGIPNSVMNKVKVHLASDTKLGGFAETVLAPIAQVELNNAQSGWGAGFGMLIGRVESRDFRWSTLRSRSGGANIINQFSTNILKPLLTDSLTDRQMESRKETLSGLIENVVKDNGQDYNPLW
ncbi:MAG: hypothetical protein KC493_16780, partial [Bacteriovoracaceae bacterium]|nr:hypothetical protein [Bacteriovoracaceae bacterium]